MGSMDGEQVNNHDDQHTGSGAPDTGATEPSDLNRALAEAIIMGTDTAKTSPADVASAPRPVPATVNLDGCVQWRSEDASSRSAKTILGIDYSPAQMAIIELAVAKRTQRLVGVMTADCQGSAGADVLNELLSAHTYPPGTDVHLSLTSPRAVVRHFRLPKLARKQRAGAARWEARKLIPFQLDEASAIYGFDFALDADGRCRVTLAAVPREDTAEVLDAIQTLKWNLQSVSVAGTKMCPCSRSTPKGTEAVPFAVVHWSPHRVTFVVFKQTELLFHYDMGLIPMPGAEPDGSISIEQLQKWIRSLGKSVSEAFEFYGGANPENPVGGLELYGLPDAVAPLITDLSERLSVPVQLKDPLQPVREDVPPDVRRWLDRNGAQILPAYLAAVGQPTVDLTPIPLRQRKRSHHHGVIARSAFAGSLAVLLAWAGLLWTQRTLTEQAGERLGTELQTVESSPIHAQIQDCLSRTQAATRLNTLINQHGLVWTPALKSIIASFPEHTRLVSLTATLAPETHDIAATRIRLEGIIYPTQRAHALILADWLRELELAFGASYVRLESTRAIEWKERRKTAFVITVDAISPRGGSTSP